MAKKSKKSVVKSAALENSIESSLAALNAANDNGANAIAILSKIGKTLSAEGKSLSKKRATLSKRKKATSAKLKKSSDAGTRKLLKTTEKELSAVKKLAAKSTASRSANSVELTGLKAQARRTAAYIKALDAAEKVLNKPKKKRRKKRAKKTTA